MLKLKYNEKEYTEFKMASINQSLDSLPRHAILELSDDDIPVKGNCTLFIDNQVFIEGQAISFEEINSDDGARRSLVIADKSYIASESNTIGREWEGASLEQIASDIVLQFGLSVKAEFNPVIKRFSCHPTESVFIKLDALSDMTDQFLISDGNGQIIFKQKQQSIESIDDESIESLKWNKNFLKKKIFVYSQSSIHNKKDGEIVRNYVLPSGENIEQFLQSKERIGRYSGNTIELIIKDIDIFLKCDLGDTIKIYDDVFTIFKRSYLFDEEKGERVILELRGEE